MQEPANQRHIGPGMTRTHTVATRAGLLQLLGSIPTPPRPSKPALAGLRPVTVPRFQYQLHPTAGLGAPLPWPSRPLARVAMGGAALRVTGVEEPPPAPDGGDFQS